MHQVLIDQSAAEPKVRRFLSDATGREDRDGVRRDTGEIKGGTTTDLDCLHLGLAAVPSNGVVELLLPDA